MVNKSIINSYLQALKSGEIILYPTDATIGLGCDILNQKGIENIYKLKKRSREKPLLLLVSSIEMLKQYVKSVHPRIETLLVYHKRPLTIIYKANQNVPKNLLAANASIGIRYTHHPFCKALIDELGRPITSTSANIASEQSPVDFKEVPKLIRENTFYKSFEEIATHSSNLESVVANYNEEGELLILRG